MPAERTPLLCHEEIYDPTAALASQTNRGKLSERQEAAFRFPEPGVYVLCYKFRKLGYFQLFPRMLALVVSFESASPRAAALGCATTIAIQGRGFSSFTAYSRLLPEPTCGFGAHGSSALSVLSDTQLECTTLPPLGARANQSHALHVSMGNATASMPPAAHVLVFNASHSAIETVTPTAASTHSTRSIEVTGAFEDYGTPTCRFDTLVAPAVVHNATHATCGKPAPPTGDGPVSGVFSLAFAPNGQCYSPRGSLFTIHNSQVSTACIKPVRPFP